MKAPLVQKGFTNKPTDRTVKALAKDLGSQEVSFKEFFWASERKLAISVSRPQDHRFFDVFFAWSYPRTPQNH